MAFGGKMLVDWELVSPVGPNLAFHAGCTVGNSFYIHGGVDRKDSKIPSNKFYCMDASMQWTEINTPGSPTLSHHVAVAMQNRFVVLIGGWTGKARTSNVICYDTEKRLWTFPTVTGFPEGGGLSSHTATPMDNGMILILGREGGLRTQRKHGSGFLLQGSPEEKKFSYSEYTQATASRSGHTANVAASTLFIIGGRDNNFIESQSVFKKESDVVGSEKFMQIAQKLKPVDKPPPCRKNHVTITGNGALLVHGGETFDGKNKEPVGEMYILTVKPIAIYSVGKSMINRAGHVCGIVNDQIVLHGGIGKGNIVYGDTHKLACYV